MMEPGKYLDSLRSAIRKIGDEKGWSFNWPERSGYAHGELAELVEAVRGKRGEVADEAGDALITLLALIPPDVPMTAVLEAANAKLLKIGL